MSSHPVRGGGYLECKLSLCDGLTTATLHTARNGHNPQNGVSDRGFQAATGRDRSARDERSGQSLSDSLFRSVQRVNGAHGRDEELAWFWPMSTDAGRKRQSQSATCISSSIPIPRSPPLRRLGVLCGRPLSKNPRPPSRQHPDPFHHA